MKKLIHLFLLLPFISYSQITVTSSNLPNIGDTLIQASDYNTNYTPGNSGANIYWDFSNAAGGLDMLLGFIDPALTPYQAAFSSSNLCVEIDTDDYFYLNRSSDGLKVVGMVDSGIVYPFAMMVLPTPLNYLDTLVETFIQIQFDSAFSNPIPANYIDSNWTGTVDSVKFTSGRNTKNIVDGWGQLALPIGTFDVLRVLEHNYEFQSMEYRISSSSGQSQWVQDPLESSMSWTEGKYSWRTNDPTVNWSLVEMEIDSLGNSSGEITYFLGNYINNVNISPPMIDLDALINVSCNGNADAFIMLDVFGTATPITLSWTGPNGFTSTSQDIFNLEHGTYEVNVTDANGNSTVEIYVITEPLTISVTESITDVSCNGQNGGKAILTVSGGTGILTVNWNGMNPYNLPAGTHAYTVTDDNGCAYTDDVTINQPPPLNAAISQSVLDLSVNVSGGIPPYSYLWNTGPPDTLSTITPSSNSVYDCDVIDKVGCITNASFTVTNVPTSILEVNSEKSLIKIVDVLGRENKASQDGPLFYIYDNGTVEKRIILE